MKKKSNLLTKVLIFVIIAAISCLFFFGLSDAPKTDMELVSFGFLMFAELVICLGVVVSDVLKLKKLNGADIVSAGILYAVFVIIINYVIPFLNMRYLLVYNIAAILGYALLLLVVSLNKSE